MGDKYIGTIIGFKPTIKTLYELKIYVFLIVSSISEVIQLPVNYTINYLTMGFGSEFHRFNYLERKQRDDKGG